LKEKLKFIHGARKAKKSVNKKVELLNDEPEENESIKEESLQNLESVEHENKKIRLLNHP